MWSVSLTLSEGIVESNPRKFNLDAAELNKRKNFITSTRHRVKVSHTHTTHTQWHPGVVQVEAWLQGTNSAL